jgi:hypothetical protein
MSYLAGVLALLLVRETFATNPDRHQGEVRASREKVRDFALRAELRTSATAGGIFAV